MPAIQNFLNALAVNPEADHIWEYLKQSCKSAVRTDLEDLCNKKDLNGFRNNFNFLDPKNMPKPDL